MFDFMSFEVDTTLNNEIPGIWMNIGLTLGFFLTHESLRALIKDLHTLNRPNRLNKSQKSSQSTLHAALSDRWQFLRAVTYNLSDFRTKFILGNLIS